MKALLGLGLMLSTASAKDANEGPWLKALSERFVVLHVSDTDLNGDGRRESVICYQDGDDSPDGGGGVAIVEKRGRRSLFHVRFDHVWCERSKASRGKLSLQLKSRQPGRSEGRLRWVYGRDFGFPGHPAHPLARHHRDPRPAARVGRLRPPHQPDRGRRGPGPLLLSQRGPGRQAHQAPQAQAGAEGRVRRDHRDAALGQGVQARAA